MNPPKKCLSLFARLSKYLDGELTARETKAIRKHMEGCTNCLSFLKTLEKTVELCRQYPAHEVPPPIKSQAREDLLGAYRSGIKKRRKSGSTAP